MTQFGYLPQTGAGVYKPPKQTSLAHAASQSGLAGNDPYGLSTAKNDTMLPLGGAAAAKAAPPYSASQVTASVAANPQASSGAYGITRTGQTVGAAMPNIVSAATTPTAAGVNNYDVNTDAGLQQILPVLGQSDENANASAQKQIRDQLLAYGDPTLAASLGDPTLAQAAAQNPTSTVAQLGHQRDTNLKSLTDQLNANNLIYSGYRVNQEQQAATDYQNQLAQAAAAVNGNIDQIHQNLTAALGANSQSRAQAISDAASRLASAAASAGVDPGDTSSVPAGDQTALALAGAGTGAGAGAASPTSLSQYTRENPFTPEQAKQLSILQAARQAGGKGMLL